MISAKTMVLGSVVFMRSYCALVLLLLLPSLSASAQSSSSMSLVGSSLVSDLTRVEARVSIRNPSASSKIYNLEL